MSGIDRRPTAACSPSRSASPSVTTGRTRSSPSTMRCSSTGTGAAGNLRDRQALGELLTANGVDPDAVFAEVDSGRPLATIKAEHTAFVASHNVWGVPTFVIDEKAVFVRLLDGSAGDGAVATRTVDRILDQVEWPILNELKHTSIPR